VLTRDTEPSTAPPPCAQQGGNNVIPITDTVDDDEICTAMTAAVAG
jgi:hypothetical protein